MSPATKRRLLITLFVPIVCVLLVAVTYAQLRYRETELEWHTLSLGIDKVRLQIPIDWQVEPDTNLNSGGIGNLSRHIVPPPQPNYLPQWFISMLGSDRSRADDLVVTASRMIGISADGKEHLSCEGDGRGAIYAARRTFEVPEGPTLAVAYARADRRVINETHKRICESLQLVH